jgi:hypothetical protein
MSFRFPLNGSGISTIFIGACENLQISGINKIIRKAPLAIELFDMSSSLMKRELRNLCGEILQMTVDHPRLKLQISQQLDSIFQELRTTSVPEMLSPSADAVPVGSLASLKSKSGSPVRPYKSTASYKCLFEKFHEEPRHPDLLAVAKGLEARLEPSARLGRAEKRKKDRLFKWFDDHWDALGPLIEMVVLVPKDIA